MKTRSLGFLTSSALVAALITLLFIGAEYIFFGGSIFSSGSLLAITGQPRGGVSSHAELANNCAACHTAPWDKTSMAERCLACHKEVAAQLQQPGSLHAVLLAKAPAPVCRPCHTEHKGANASITSMPAGGFPHDAVGFSLAAHPKLSSGKPFTCQDCHPQGPTTFDVSICSTCHQTIDAAFMQKHSAAYGSACLGCHDGKESYGKAFDHNKVSFILTGKHTSLDCGACHSGARRIADLKTTKTACYDCHQKDDAHKGDLGQDCAVCHNSSDWKLATFDHSKSAFPLTGAHATVDCAHCHINNVFIGTPTQCYACHQKDDQHKGAFGQDCAACHNTTAWLPASFDHSKTAFPLNGAHSALACTKCHTNGVFKGTPTTCSACHTDPAYHQGLFGLNCASCHTTTAWQPAAFSLAHAFPLNHGEAGGICQACHPDSLAVYTCYSCHANIKNNRRHAGFANLDNCIACHANGRGGD